MSYKDRTTAMLSCLIAITAFSTQSYAQDKKLYLSAYLGLNTIEDQDYSNSAVPVNGEIESDSAVSFAGALGFRLNRSIRVEAEVGYSSSDLSSINTNAGSGPLNGDMEALTFMLSGYSDFDLDWPVVPYIGAGAGFGLFDSNIRDGGSGFTQNSSGDDWSFIYQVGGGLKYHMSEDMSLSGGYRYIGASDIEFDQTDVDYSAHEFRFGLHYDLPISWDE